MVKKVYNQKGLSVLELLIVATIVGILVGLVMPRLIDMVLYSRTVEAFDNIGYIHRAID